MEHRCLRHGRERLPPADYAQYSYYEKWIAGLAKMLVEHGIASAEEIAAGRSLPRRRMN